jgi:hypothetical protein
VTLTASRFDSALRYHVASRSQAHEVHLVELDSYAGNGECSCTFFRLKLEPLLRRLVTPEQALAQRLVRLKPGQREQDALRCWHLVEARDQFATDMLTAILSHEKAHTPAAQRTA